MRSSRSANQIGPTTPTTSSAALLMSAFAELLTGLAHALDGIGPPVEVTADGNIVDRSDVLERFAQAAVVVRTSGSTGTPKQTVLSAAALQASATATADYLGFAGQWLLTLPVNYVAGLAVLTRSLLAGHTPKVLPAGSFTADSFIAGAAQLDAERTLVSLVPTQLQRILQDPAATKSAATIDAILVGGGPIHEHLYQQAQQEGLRIVRTYGMAETCGGCVYDGRPLPGVDVKIDDEQRVCLSGPMLAEGYVDPQLDAERFLRLNDQRYYLTDDQGSFTDGLLRVTGRIDDVINTGGIKVSAATVQAALAKHTHAEVVVIGVPDEQWGTKVCVAIEDLHADTAELARLAAGDLPAEALPKDWLRTEALPRLSTGKVDRVELRRHFQKG